MKKNSFSVKTNSVNPFSLDAIQFSASKSESKNLFLYLHSLPGAQLKQLSYIPELLGKLGYDSIAFNYPGIWNAGGFFSINDVNDGINAILQYVSEHFKSYSEITLFGESFGGAVAFNIVNNLKLPIPIHKIVLRSPVLDFNPLLPFLPATLGYLKQAKIIKVENIQTLLKEIQLINPIHFYSKLVESGKVRAWGVFGKNDEVLPYLDMIKAIEKYPQIKIEIWDDFPHNNIDDHLYALFSKKLHSFVQN
jgi:pimeloyl-ACP methyl ester carboxylesterase